MNKNRIAGAAKTVAGRAKEKIGKAVGDQKMHAAPRPKSHPRFSYNAGLSARSGRRISPHGDPARTE
ncbi:MAG: CsbD family protein [Rhodospirillaceae bacterium]|nr:CsbD family protein [Rhodospirillaceae bacterium]